MHQYEGIFFKKARINLLISSKNRRKAAKFIVFLPFNVIFYVHIAIFLLILLKSALRRVWRGVRGTTWEPPSTPSPPALPSPTSPPALQSPPQTKKTGPDRKCPDEPVCHTYSFQSVGSQRCAGHPSRQGLTITFLYFASFSLATISPAFTCWPSET